MAHWTPSNHNNADEYIGSCLPYVTSSTAANLSAGGMPHVISFPYVTRWIIIQNNGDGGAGTPALRIGFTGNGIFGFGSSDGRDHYFQVGEGQGTGRLELKVKEIMVGGVGGTPAYNVIAGYTNIPTKNFPTLTGSAGFKGVG